MKNLKIKISGKVQGVWYRVSTKKKADELKLSGFVRNESDNSVYVEVSGENPELGEFILWLKEGPELANVESVTIMDNDIDYTVGFNIN